MECFSWSPMDPLEKYKLNLGNYALMILNQPIILPPEEMISLWNGAIIRSTVDGGTERWFDYLEKHNIKIENKFPNILSGDFDSISPTLLKKCQDNGVYIEKTPDQTYTDFEKAVQVIKKCSSTKIDSLLAVLECSGRLDHTFSSLNVLHRISNIFTDYHPTGFLLGFSSLTWLLKPGTHTISIPSYLREQHACCGILPFVPVKNNISTTGLKWNLNNQCVEFGGLISSSNTYDGNPEVTITTNAEILWSMCLGRDN